MTIEYIKLLPDQQTNRANLSVSMSPIRCTYCGTYDSMLLPAEIARQLERHLPHKTAYLSSMEVFGNGEANVFVRRNGKAIGFFRIRH